MKMLLTPYLLRHRNHLDPDEIATSLALLSDRMHTLLLRFSSSSVKKKHITGKIVYLLSLNLWLY